MSHYRSVDPSRGDELQRFSTLSGGELDARLARSGSAFIEWRRSPLAERTDAARNLAEALETNGEAAARLMAREMGKPVAEGRAEVAKCALAARYYAEHAERFLSDEPTSTDAAISYVAYQPLGSILAVMPWNYPLWQVVRAATPALLAGNAVLLKHAPNVPGCAQLLEELFLAAGFPEGCLQNLFVTHSQVQEIIASDVVCGVTLTGSVRAGKAVAQQAAAHIKPTVLELGGSDPYLILEDADVEEAAVQCARSRLINAGQSCIAAKRLIVVEAVRRRFTEALVDVMSGVHVGDPLEDRTQMGPLAREDLRATLHDQVCDSLALGARCLIGGEIPEGPGWFYPPSVLDGVESGMRAYQEELFGPVASILSVPDRARAIEVANDTSFGLGAGIFTSDVQEGERIAREELRAGSCFVNAFVRSDPRLPFGGVGESGYGRELSRLGILAFTNAKTVYVA